MQMIREKEPVEPVEPEKSAIAIRLHRLLIVSVVVSEFSVF